MRNDNVDARGKPRVQTVFDDESLTLQSEAELGDINHVMRRFAATGTLQSLNDAMARYMDITEFTDLGDAIRQAREAEVAFKALPSKVREIFNHDVAEWLDAAHDPEKRDDLVTAGALLDSGNPSDADVTAAAVSEGGAAGESQSGATAPDGGGSEV